MNATKSQILQLLGIPGNFPSNPLFDAAEILQQIRDTQTPPTVVHVPKNEYDYYGAKAVQQAAEKLGVVVVPEQYREECVRRFEMPERAELGVHIDTSDLPNPRYHDRIFPKHFDKKKKTKRRMQKHSRHK